MPNAHKTPARAIRVPDELWNAAMAKSKGLGITLTSVLLEALEKFVASELDKDNSEA